MTTTASDILGQLQQMQEAMEGLTSQVESFAKDKQATDRAMAIYKEKETHYEHMMACRDVSIEALKKAVYTKSSHHAKLAALVKANLTEEQIKSYKAKSHQEALRLHQATTEKNEELYAKEEKAERATIDLHKKKLLSIKEKFKTTGKGAATKEVHASTQGPKGPIAKKTKDGKPKAAKKPSPTTPRCRFISAMTKTWSDEREAAQLTNSSETFPALFAWINPRWTALSAADGAICEDFGDGGTVDLTEGMGMQVSGFASNSSGPTVLGDTIVIGQQVSDNQQRDAPSGVVRAYDANTGDLLWAWDALRQGIAQEPLEEGEVYPRGTPNIWNVISGDPEAGLVYVGTGNSANDHYGGTRTPEEDRFTAAIVAIAAAG